MVVRMRHTRGHTRNRRSHHALGAPRLSACANCKAPHVRHRACPSCGTYRGRVVIDVASRAAREAKRKSARGEKRASEESAAPKEEKPASIEELSRK